MMMNNVIVVMIGIFLDIAVVLEIAPFYNYYRANQDENDNDDHDDTLLRTGEPS